MFGQIEAAVFGVAGEVVVADSRLQRVAVYDSAGRFRRTIGRVGQGPGELLMPVALALLGDTLFVFDRRQGRVSVFSYDGAFLRAFPAPTTLLSGLAPGPNGTLIFAARGGEAPLVQMTTGGRIVRQLLPSTRIQGQLGESYAPEPGSFCVRDTTVTFLNSWVYEIVQVNTGDASVLWSRAYKSDVLQPVKSRDASLGPSVRGGGTIGLACTSSYVIAAYIDLRSPRSIIDFLTPDGEPAGRMVFDRDNDGGTFPGVIADANGNLLLTYRNRPYPVVMTWQIGPQARPMEGA